jgi:uncharacterized protein (TIGR03435 family)
MKKLALWVAMSALLPAQTPGPAKKAEFEAASIHPATDDGDHDLDTDKGLFRTHNLTLKRLIATAWDIDAAQVLAGPNWLDSDTWDVTARVPSEFAQQTREKVPPMLQNLLADRFQLVVHREPHQVSGYVLTVAKKGPKMEQAKGDEEGSNTASSDTYLTAKNLTMEAFARRLSRNRDIGKLVVDKTGLTGRFNFELQWIPESLESSQDDRTSIFTALQEQLGLKLESARVTTQAIVVDRADKPDHQCQPHDSC